MGDGRGVGAVFAALKDGHGEDGVAGGERGEFGIESMEELDAGVAVLFAGLCEAPAIDVDADDGGAGENFGEREGFFAGGAAEGEDGGRGDAEEVVRTGGEELGVAVGLGEGCALEMGVAVEDAGEVFRADAWVEDKAADVAESAQGAGKRAKERAGRG